MKAGRGFAKDLADALTRVAGGGGDIKVRYAEEAVVRLGAGDEEGHQEARLVGKKYGSPTRLVEAAGRHRRSTLSNLP